MGFGTKGKRIVAWVRMRLNCQPPQASKNRNDLNTMLCMTFSELCCWDGRSPAPVHVGTSFRHMETQSYVTVNSYAFLQPKIGRNRASNRG